MFREKFKSFSDNFILICFEILAVVILLARIAYVDIKVLAVIGFVLVILFVCLNRITKATDLIKAFVRKMSVTKMIISIVVIGLLTKIVSLFLFQIDSSLHEDCGMYWSFIQQLTNNGRIIENSDYATSYQYTVIYSAFFLPFTKIFGVKSILITNLYLCILFTAASVLLFDTVKYHFGKNYAFVAVMLWILIPVGIWEPLLLVHENAFVVLHILAIWLFFRMLPSARKMYSKILYVLLIALVISYAALINRFAFISMIAMIIVLFIKLLAERISFLNIVKPFAVLLAFYLIYIGCSSAKTTYIDRVVAQPSPTVESRYLSPEGYSIPYGWTFYVGMNYEEKGAWNKEDAFRYDKYKALDNKEDAHIYQTSLIKERLDDYLSHPGKLFKHIFHKFEVISYDFNPVFKNYGNSVNTFICSGANGKIALLINTFSALIRIFVSLFVVFSFKFKKAKENCLDTYFKLFMLGTCIILAFTEVSTKYSSHLLFVYLTIAVVNFKDASSNIFALRNKLTKPLKDIKPMKKQ